MSEIKIVIPDQSKVNNPWEKFKVYINGEEIPRLRRFSLEFENNGSLSGDLESDFVYSVEQYIDWHNDGT